MNDENATALFFFGLVAIAVMSMVIAVLAVTFNRRLDEHRDFLCSTTANVVSLKDCRNWKGYPVERRIRQLESELATARAGK